MLHSATPTPPLGAKAPSDKPAKPALDLQVKLEKCVRQLSDWRGCPSGKTPQGKQIIESLAAQIRTLQSQISSAEQSGVGATATVPAGARVSAASPASSPASRPVLSTSGSLVNVFA